ncbi:uncharacterized protein ISCGN_001893 [Ixodes scapularis]
MSAGGSSELLTPAASEIVPTTLDEINARLEILHSLKANVDRLSVVPAKVEEFLALKPSVDAMKEKIRSLQESVKKYESTTKLVTENDKEVKLLRTEVGALQATVSEQTVMIDQLQTNINSTEQYSRRCNMEIHGISYLNKEDLGATIIDLAHKLNIADFNPADVVVCHRLRSRREGAPPILIQFTSVPTKDRWMNARKKLATLPRKETWAGSDCENERFTTISCKHYCTDSPLGR